MKLLDMLENLPCTCVQGSLETEITSLVYDSRKAEKGSLFVCIRGAAVDGHKFTDQVIAQGAELLGWPLEELLSRTLEAMKPDEAAIREEMAAL